MKSLTVNEYNSAEEKACSELPNRVVEGFHPYYFGRTGYPCHVRTEKELFKYIDVMHENRFEGDFENFITRLTMDEFDLLKDLSQRICSFSEAEFQKKAVARASVIRALNTYRRIHNFLPLYGNNPPAVFELGPGSGYLGAMLLLSGYPYAAMDVTQAFYLWQSRFWNFLSDGKVFELVNNRDLSVNAFHHVPNGVAVHLPWWDFVRLNPHDVPHFDIVTCNHALCEMHKYSLGFALRIARFMLRKQEGSRPKMFVFEGYGAPDFNSIDFVNQCFNATGFSLVHSDPFITIFVPRESNEAGQGRSPGNGNGEFTSRIAYVSALNELYRTMPHKTVGIDALKQFYTTLLGSPQHLTPDESFLRFIGVHYI